MNNSFSDTPSTLSILLPQKFQSPLSSLLRMTYPRYDHIFTNHFEDTEKILKEKSVEFIVVGNTLEQSKLSELKATSKKILSKGIPIIMVSNPEDLDTASLAHNITLGVTAVLFSPLTQEGLMDSLEVSKKICEDGSYQRLKVASFLHAKSKTKDGYLVGDPTQVQDDIKRYACELLRMSQSQRLRAITFGKN